MFKLTLAFVTLAAFQGALASPIPQDLSGITGTLAEFAGSVSGAPDTGLSIRQDDDAAFDDLFEGVTLRQDDSGDDDDDFDGPLKRQLDLGALVHDAVIDVPSVVSIAGEVVERPVVGLLNLKRQLGDVLGGVSTGEVGSLLGGAGGLSNVGGLLKRQDDDGTDDDDDIAERQLPAVGSIVSGLPVVGGLVDGLPVVGGSEGGLPIVGGLLGNGLLKRQVGVSGLGSSTVNDIPLIGDASDLGELSSVEDPAQL